MDINKIAERVAGDFLTADAVMRSVDRHLAPAKRFREGERIKKDKEAERQRL